VYGGSPGLGMVRQALHATTLAFRHPVTDEALRFGAQPPADFAAAWETVTGVPATP